MTFERLNRATREGGPLWGMSLADNGRSSLYGPRLVIEPSTHPNPAHGTVLHVWIEDRRARHHWIREVADRRRPSGPPTWIVDDIEVERTRRLITAKHPFEYIVIQALFKGDLHGESAAGAVQQLFWQHFIEDDDGLNYLCKFAEPDIGNHYARDRLLRYVETYYDDVRVDHSMSDAINDAMKHNRTLGARFAKQHAKNRNMRDALQAIDLTGEPDETKQKHVRQIVELNATRMDYVIAAIVDATRSDQALLGLRACQRVEADEAFFVAVDAFVLAHPKGNGLGKFLKPHLKDALKLKKQPQHSDGDDVGVGDENEVDDV